MVIGAGRQKSTSATLVKACDRYYYLDQRRRAAARVDPDRRSVHQAASWSVPSERAWTPRARSPAAASTRRCSGSIPASTFATGASTASRPLGSSSEVRGPARGQGQAMLSSSCVEAVRIVALQNSVGRCQNRCRVDEARSLSRKLHARSRSSRRSRQCARRFKAQLVGHKNLQRLLDAMPQLAKNWRRDGNVISRK